MERRLPSRPSLREGSPALLVLLLAGSAQAQLVCLKADMIGAEEVPPTPSTATGTTWGIMDRAANTLSLDVHFSGIAPGTFAYHIHGMAPKGVTGAPPIYAPPLNTMGPSVWNYMEGQEQGLLDGLTYVNVHSQAYVSGEIRGQFEIVHDAAFMVVTLTGAQVVPPATTTASGTGYFAIDTATNSAVYRIDVSGFSSPETVAEIRGFANPGSNGSLLAILALGNSKVGTWNYSEPDEAALLAGLAYVEIRTNGASGELRGQIVPGSTNPDIYCTAKTNSCGTLPAMLYLGFPSATATTGFRVGVVNARGTKAGLLIYSDAGPTNQPFLGGTLCVAPMPLKRGPPKVDGNGTAGQCNGVLSMDMNEFAAGLGGGNPAPFLSLPGRHVTCQWWARDTVANGSLLSNALSYVVGP
jgi:hypothetical protein